MDYNGYPMGMNQMGMNQMGMNQMGLDTMGMNPMGMNQMGMDPMGMNQMAIDPMGMNQMVMNQRMMMMQQQMEMAQMLQQQRMLMQQQMAMTNRAFVNQQTQQQLVDKSRFGVDQGMQEFNQDIYGEYMADGKRFKGYTIAEIEKGLMEYIKENTGREVYKIVYIDSYPESIFQGEQYGLLRHACAYRGISFIAPNFLNIPEMDLTLYFYYCTQCRKLYYCKSKAKVEAKLHSDVMRQNNKMLNQAEKEYKRGIERAIKDEQRLAKAYYKEQAKLYKQQMKWCGV